MCHQAGKQLALLIPQLNLRTQVNPFFIQQDRRAVHPDAQFIDSLNQFIHVE